MDEILGNAKNILIIWTVDADQDKLSAFQDTLRTKSKTAQIAPEKVQDFSQCKSNFELVRKQ